MQPNRPTLRDYQADRFIGPIRAAYAAGSMAVCAVLPTGGGKTVSFSWMVRAAMDRGLSVGVCAHRIELLDQIARTLDMFGIRYGFIAPGRLADPFAAVQICSVQSLANRIAKNGKRPFDFLIVDEAHHAAAGTSWHKVIKHHAGKRVLGVTATPIRLGGQALSDAFDALVIGPTTRELIDLGALCDYRAFAPTAPDMSGVPTRMREFGKAETEKVMDKPSITGSMVLEYLKLARGKRALAFCVSVKHAEDVAAEFCASGIRASSLDGTMDRKQRADILADFEAGRLLVITSCDVVSEGLDVPAIEAVILGRPTQSLTMYLQQVGRALRPFPGKDRALILDHAGNIARHGFPDDEREWSLNGSEVRAGGKSEQTVHARICPACMAAFKPGQPRCPECKAVMEIKSRIVEEVAGELAELDREAIERAAKMEKSRERGMAKTLPELAKVAVKNKYKPAWIIHMAGIRGIPRPTYQQAVDAMRRAS